MSTAIAFLLGVLCSGPAWWLLATARRIKLPEYMCPPCRKCDCKDCPNNAEDDGDPVFPDGRSPW